MSEQLLAADLRQDALSHASKEDKPFFAIMPDRQIIERALICKVCERSILAYDMAILADTVKELGTLLAKFGDMEHIARCLDTMERLGPEGMARLVNQRDEG